MEIKKSKVKSAEFQKSFNGNYGEMFVHEITFENGDKGQYLSKSNPQNKFVQGNEVEYEFSITQNGQFTNTSIKPIKDPATFVATKQRGGNESFALSYAKDMAVAYLNKGNELSTAQIIELAEKFYLWLNSKKQ